MLFKNKHIKQQPEDLTQDFTQDNGKRNEDSSQKPLRKIIDGKMYDTSNAAHAESWLTTRRTAASQVTRSEARKSYSARSMLHATNAEMKLLFLVLMMRMKENWKVCTTV